MSEMSPAEAVFFAALEKQSAAERAAYLDGACAGQPELRVRVDKLLAAQPHVGEFLEEKPAADVTLTLSPNSGDPTADYLGIQPGVVIAGKYKLLQQIGEGGMGTVWMADQTEPVKRRVAVKLIRIERGNSATILARFEAERQAIALMDHPNIAKLLDAGTTDAGQPYFIMELVKGVPLTEYCDTHRLSIQQRLGLFQQICSAVQHAHQKGIIHRDLKPTNILVESHDHKPVPKVIDFGLAKATSGLQLTEHTMFTAFGSVMGTPLYMAPEQARFNAVDIDTRADIYALGIILYELLTGTTPLTRDTVKKAAIDEMLRLVREQEAPTPSSRLSRADSLPSVAANRQSEPQKLGRFVKGELDWIVLKALSKERDRRYDTANGFAKDIERFLNHEPVLAGPVTAVYRVKKFVQRNRGQVIAGVMVLSVLLAGIAGTTVGLIKSNRAADAERNAKEDAVIAKSEAEAEGQKAVFQLGRAEDALRIAKEQQTLAERAAAGERLAKIEAEAQKAIAIKSATAEKQAKLEAQTRLTQLEKGNDILFAIFEDLDIGKDVAKGSGEPLEAVLAKRLVQATKQLEGEALGDREEVAWLQNKVGATLVSLGHTKEAIPLLEKASDTYSKLLGPENFQSLRAKNTLALAYLDLGHLEKAVKILEILYTTSKAKRGIEDRATLEFMNNLAQSYQQAGKPDQAQPLHEENLRQRIKIYGDRHLETLCARHNLALCYATGGRFAESLELETETLRLSRLALGENHPHTLIVFSHVAECQRRIGQLDRALILQEEILRLTKTKMGTEHPQTLMAMNNLAVMYQDAGRDTDALKLMEETLRVKRDKLGNEHPETIRGMANLAAAQWALGQLDRSIPLFEEALRLQTKFLSRSHPYTLETVANLGVNYFDAGRVREAIPLLEEAYRGSKKFPDLLWIRDVLHEACVKEGKNDLAAKLVREIFADVQEQIRSNAPLEHSDLASSGNVMVRAKMYPEAEMMLRRCLALREKNLPDSWKTFATRSMLGEALLGQKKYAEAEPLLLKGYEGMKAREKTMPRFGKIRIPEAVDRLIDLYTATNKPDEVKKWQDVKAKLPKPAEKKS